MNKDSKKKTISHLKRAGGMLDKVIEMVEGDKYCIDVLQQSLAVIGFTKSANKELLENHLNCCFKEGMKTNNKKREQELIDELMKIVNKV